MHQLDKLAQDWVEGRLRWMKTDASKFDAKSSWFSYVTTRDDDMLDRMGYSKSVKAARQ